MKISVLGGGNEVGASCLHIEIAETKLLIDAGMRMHGDNPLPALGMLDELGAPDVVLVTHAHADHIGALPIVHSLYPNCPIYATPPTVDLMKIMMNDSYKILEQRSKETNTLPPYTDQQVDSLLQSLLFFPANEELAIGNVKIKSYRAGHILGAVMFLIEGDGEKLFVTGDLSFKAGRTINGAEVLHGIQPDVLIMESTYGNRTHTDRNTEENRLAMDVTEIVANGGFALIPAFALGRAQEILLVLQDYMDKGLIPEFPIYVDGLVTPISKVYKQYPHFLKGPVAYRIKNNGDVFLTEGRCKAVHPKEREEILKGKPGCIVASSGMLIGGASSWYAQRLVGNEKNAIFITGYQDEESPGKKLLNIADGVEKQLDLNGVNYPVNCQVGKYGLSAHADANEMNRFVQALQPTYTLLVHGDDGAREQLSNVLDSKYHPILVENGEIYPFEKRNSGKGIVGKRYQSQEDALLKDKIGSLLLYQKDATEAYKLAICVSVHWKTKLLICQTLTGKQIKLSLAQVKETICSWNRSIDELKQAADEVLSFSRPYLENIAWEQLPDAKISLQAIYQALRIEDIKVQIAVALAVQSIQEETESTYSFNRQTKEQLTNMEAPIQGIRLNSAHAMEKVRNYLTDHPRFIRCGVDNMGTEQETLTIYFDFPDAILEKERQSLTTILSRETGWAIRFSDSVRQDLLQVTLTKLMGPLLQVPSIHLQEKKIVITTDNGKLEQGIVDQFKKETGFDLHIKGEKMATSSTKESEHIFQATTSSKRLENNQAMEEAKKWAKERNLTIYKTSMKQHGSQTVMEVHFISPEIARCYEVELTELSYRIGMPVTYAKTPKQNEIIQWTLEAVPAHWAVKKNPSLHTGKGEVSLKLEAMPEPQELSSIREKVKATTGYNLDVIL